MAKETTTWSVQDAIDDIVSTLQPDDSIKVYGIGTEIITRIAHLNEHGEIASYRIDVPKEEGKRMFPIEALKEHLVGRTLCVDNPHAYIFGTIEDVYGDEHQTCIQYGDGIGILTDTFSDEEIWTTVSGLAAVRQWAFHKGGETFETKYWLKPLK